MRYIGDTQAGIAANYHEPDEHRKHANTLELMCYLKAILMRCIASLIVRAASDPQLESDPVRKIADIPILALQDRV